VAILLVALLGAGNFAMHKAVLESRHPLLGQVPWLAHRHGRKAGLAVEFVLLLGALLLVAAGRTAWGWAYLGYTVLNGMTAWAILTRRI
jgi:hypothetical protein